jgi:PD-(D/E)XK nuclease superfamily
MLSDRDKQEILGKLIIDNQDLDFLESTLSEFNIFEAIGVVRQEIRHSNVISFLLNPQETHRLSDLFLKKLLICALLKSENPPLSPIEIDIANLENVEIRREWKNIDILIHSPINQFVCVIENKVDSSEHSDQLKRYEAIIDGEFPEYHKLFVYLTKGGYSASREKWLPLSYEEVVNEIESIYNKYRSTMGDDVYTLISHYVSLVRRHIVSNSEIANLCQKIYKQHRQALDLIYEHRPDLQSEISEFIQQIIQDSVAEDIEEDYSIKQFIRFAPKGWDNLSFQKTCDKWTQSNRLLLFEFVNEPYYLGLHLVIGPSDKITKQHIFDTIRNLDIPGHVSSKLSERRCSHINRREILNYSDYLDGDLETIKEKIKFFWNKYLNHEMKIICPAIKNASWVKSLKD